MRKRLISLGADPDMTRNWTGRPTDGGAMDDETLIALAQQRFDDTDREGATHEECRQLRDVFPAVIQRLRENAEITLDLVKDERLEWGKPGVLDRIMKAIDEPASLDQFDLLLTHL